MTHEMGAPGKILLVEDDPDLTAMMEIVLREAGFDTVATLDGQEALDLIEQEMPALILLDLNLPAMDGWHFAHRYWEKYGHVAPVVVVTPAGEAGSTARELDAEGYLGKPFGIDDLIRVIRRLVDGATPSH